ncbi:MAG: hypothetical protein NTY80_04195 [candidate division SR1 bacterium]|nr:hypothetical protein [candidate division SR1 bacterium]
MFKNAILLEMVELKSQGMGVWTKLNSSNAILLEIEEALSGKSSFHGTLEDLKELKFDLQSEIFSLLEQSKDLTKILDIPPYDYLTNPNPETFI